MNRTALRGRAWVDGGIRDNVTIVLEDDLIADVVIGDTVQAQPVGGLMVPGFIDLHVHGARGADFMDADPAAVQVVTAWHAQHGTTALCATTLSAPPEALLKTVRAIARTGSIAGASEIIGIHLEGPYLSPRKCGAQDVASLRPADLNELSALLAEAPGKKWMMTVAPEVDGVLSLIELYKDRVLFSVGHSEAGYGEVIDAFERGAKHVTHLFNAMTPLKHRQPGAVGAAMVSIDTTAEIIADGVHVHPGVLRIARQLMPRRLALVTDAMRACGMADGVYKLYRHDVHVRDGAARLEDGTLAGSVLTMIEAVQNMVELAGVPLEEVLPMATEVPAHIIGVSDRKGKLAPGYDADLLVINARFEIERMFVRGTELEHP